MEVEPTEKPDLCASGHVVVATAHYPPPISGSAVIMRNLLTRFDPSSYTVATTRDRSVRREASPESEVQYLMTSFSLSARLNYRWKDMQIVRARTRLIDLIERKRPKVVVAVYPDYYFLRAAQEACEITEVPWIAYFHDTLAEHQSRNYLNRRASALQEKVFAEAERILVMSRGMAELFEEKYGLDPVPLLHTYPEPIPSELHDAADVLNQAFWGGAVYGINARSIGRIASALEDVSCPLVIASRQKPTYLTRLGIEGDTVSFTFFPERAVYLEALKRQGILLLALDWPDESNTHEQELATIFPTKTPEYLAAGRPILVHCPEHYFLARFFREHGGGLVVSERSQRSLTEACSFLLEDHEATRTMRRNALETAKLFAAERVGGLFQRIVNEVAASPGVQRSA